MAVSGWPCRESVKPRQLWCQEGRSQTLVASILETCGVSRRFFYECVSCFFLVIVVTWGKLGGTVLERAWILSLKRSFSLSWQSWTLRILNFRGRFSFPTVVDRISISSRSLWDLRRAHSGRPLRYSRVIEYKMPTPSDPKLTSRYAVFAK